MSYSKTKLTELLKCHQLYDHLYMKHISYIIHCVHCGKASDHESIILLSTQNLLRHFKSLWNTSKTSGLANGRMQKRDTFANNIKRKNISKYFDYFQLKL